jgi:hypothetical protein
MNEKGRASNALEAEKDALAKLFSAGIQDTLIQAMDEVARGAADPLWPEEGKV